MFERWAGKTTNHPERFLVCEYPASSDYNHFITSLCGIAYCALVTQENNGFITTPCGSNAASCVYPRHTIFTLLNFQLNSRMILAKKLISSAKTTRITSIFSIFSFGVYVSLIDLLEVWDGVHEKMNIWATANCFKPIWCSNILCLGGWV